MIVDVINNPTTIRSRQRRPLIFIIIHDLHLDDDYLTLLIVRSTSLNLQKKILKNPVFKPTFFCSICILIYDIYEL